MTARWSKTWLCCYIWSTLVQECRIKTCIKQIISEVGLQIFSLYWRFKIYYYLDFSNWQRTGHHACKIIFFAFCRYEVQLFSNSTNSNLTSAMSLILTFMLYCETLYTDVNLLNYFMVFHCNLPFNQIILDL